MSIFDCRNCDIAYEAFQSCRLRYPESAFHDSKDHYNTIHQFHIALCQNFFSLLSRTSRNMAESRGRRANVSARACDEIGASISRIQRAAMAYPHVFAT
jgi:hypothetical protein